MLTRGLALAERTRVQGIADTLVWGSAAVAEPLVRRDRRGRVLHGARVLRRSRCSSSRRCSCSSQRAAYPPRRGRLSRTRLHTVGMTRSAFSEPKRRVLALALVALVAAGCGSLPLMRPGQTPRPTPTPVPTFDPDRTGFDGKVVDVDGNPIEGVHLVIMLNSRRGTAATTAEGTFFSPRGCRGGRDHRQPRGVRDGGADGHHRSERDR